MGNVAQRKDVNVSRGSSILTNMKIKILIADDNSFIREGMKIILNTYEEFEVVDTVNDGKEAVEYCKKNDVDIALLDVRMPN
ncbi:response regulator transcription factor, partial [Acinetobacter baumannii]